MLFAILIMASAGTLSFPGAIKAAPCTGSGTDVTISVSCEFAAGTYTYSGTLTINGGVTVTAGNAGSPGQVIIQSDNINVQGTISANNVGYAIGQGTGAGSTVSSYGSGGGHGGDGGEDSAGIAGGGAYGSVTQPSTLGSGGGDDGGSASGGGAVKLVVSGTLTIDGTVSANGQNATLNQSGGGAGGSVWINAGTLDGDGTVSANGGYGLPTGTTTYGAGGGAGGRIAIYYTTDASTIISGAKHNAYGGLHGGGTNGGDADSGGAGTVFIDDVDDGDASGKLVVNNNSINYTGETALTPQLNASETYDDITISGGAFYVIGSGETLTLASGGTLTGGGTNQSKIIIESGGTYNPNVAAWTVTSIDIDNAGTVNTVTSLTLNDSTFTHHGAFQNTVTSATIQSGGNFLVQTTANLSLSTVTVQSGGVLTQGMLTTFPITTLTVLSGGNVAHSDNSTAKSYIVDISATTIDIQSGGTVNVNSLGFDISEGTGVGSEGSGGGGGGGYGGNGGISSYGDTGGSAYGSVTAPSDIGSGGGKDGSTDQGSGGGAIKLVASGTLTINGTISADGQTATLNQSGGGAGGSVWIQASALAGAGTITSTGGNSLPASTSSVGGGGGGGGRIAIHYTTDSSTIISGAKYQAYGGLKGGRGGTSTADSGGAGTVFIDDVDDGDASGKLVVDDGSVTSYTDDSPITPQLNASETYDDITISGGAFYVIGIGETLTLASGGTLTGGGTDQPKIIIESGGTYNPNVAAWTVTSIDIDNGGTVNTVTSLTLNDSTFTHHGAFQNTVTSATIQTGSNFLVQTTTNLGSSTVTVQSGGTLTQGMATSLSITTLTVQSGGNVTHSDNSTAKSYVVDISATTIDIQSGGTVNVNSLGFDIAQGTGVGSSGLGGGGGGGYGGGGGNSSYDDAGGTTYGSATAPSDIGSGGGKDGSSDEGSGGGAIKLVASGTLTINGTISADGQDATLNQSGGGSGGSIWLSADTWTGSTGVITADGGDGKPQVALNVGGGGGGGGRIYIVFATNAYTGTAPTVAGGIHGGVGGSSDATDGTAGSLTYESNAPSVDSITHSPASPEVGDDIYLTATASKDIGIFKIEIYMDGTAPGNLKKTCTFSPVETPAFCDVSIGSLSAGSHTTTVIAYDQFLNSASDTDIFSVINRTSSNSVTLGTTKAGETGVSVAISMTFAAASSGTLTVTWPTGFTVTSAALDGWSDDCFTNFGFTSSTMTATKTSCTGTVLFGGSTVTNPSTAGQYLITWENDTGSALVFIVDDDLFNISASVDPVITFNVGSQASATACNGTFAGNGGVVAFGGLSQTSVASSDANSVAHICLRFSTNASGGAVVTVLSTNASLKSASVPGDTIDSSTATLSAGTEGYGLCVGSAVGDSGTDSTTPASASVSRTSPFNTTCTSSDHNVGGVTASAQNIVSISGPSQNAFARVYAKASASIASIPHDDYADTLTFILTATY